MKKFLILLNLLPTMVFAQKDNAHYSSGIVFENNLSWEQVKAEAKAADKFIFVDCYATWCGPCKAMDSQVYPDSALGKFANPRFISIKLQMDKTPQDPEAVKQWYAVAAQFQKDYKIAAYPTFLFFDPDGKIVHEGLGYQIPAQFQETLSEALDSTKQYYTMVHHYQPGKFPLSELKMLAAEFQPINDTFANKLAGEYLSRIPVSEAATPGNIDFLSGFNKSPQVQQFVIAYLQKLSLPEMAKEKNLQIISSFSQLPDVEYFAIQSLDGLPESRLLDNKNMELLEIFQDGKGAPKFANSIISKLTPDEIFKPNVIPFINTFTRQSTDPGFRILFNNRAKINRIMSDNGDKTYADNAIDAIISHELVEPYLKPFYSNHSTPNWRRLGHIISTKYTETDAHVIIINSKVNFYGTITAKYNAYWPEFIESSINLFAFRDSTHYQPNTFSDVMINNTAYAACSHGEDIRQFQILAKLMQAVVRRDSLSETYRLRGDHIDTYACILYKAGRTEEAINWEKQSLAIAEANHNDFSVRDCSSKIAKMEAGYSPI